MSIPVNPDEVNYFLNREVCYVFVVQKVVDLNTTRSQQHMLKKRALQQKNVDNITKTC